MIDYTEIDNRRLARPAGLGAREHRATRPEQSARALRVALQAALAAIRTANPKATGTTNPVAFSFEAPRPKLPAAAAR